VVKTWKIKHRRWAVFRFFAQVRDLWTGTHDHLKCQNKVIVGRHARQGCFTGQPWWRYFFSILGEYLVTLWLIFWGTLKLSIVHEVFADSATVFIEELKIKKCHLPEMHQMDLE